MKKLLLITLMLAFGLTGFSQISFTSMADGDWNASATWDQGSIPTETDYAIILDGFTVTVPTGLTTGISLVTVGDSSTSAGHLVVNGTLNISEYNGLSLDIADQDGNNPSTVTVTGTLTYKGNVFVGDGTVGGTLTVNGTALALELDEVYNPITKRIWKDRNLGATQVATSSTDADAYGDLYQWGRLTDGHESRTSGPTPTQSTGDDPGHSNFITRIYLAEPPYDWRNPKNDNLWQGVSGINNPCPNGFRLPTKTEWEAEMNTWSPKNAAGAFNSLKLTLTGYRQYTGGLQLIGTHGYYWSSTVSGDNSYRQSIDVNTAGMDSGTRATGFAVRCIKN